MALGETITILGVTLLFAAIPACILVYFYKSRTKKLDTLIKIVELGGQVDPDMMKMLGDGGGGYKLDFKYGLIWLAIGIPLFLGIFIEAGMGQAVFGLIPVFIGIAFLISAKYRLRESS